MADEEKSTPSQDGEMPTPSQDEAMPTLTSQLSKASFEALRAMTTSANVPRRELQLDESILRPQTHPNMIKAILISAIFVAYKNFAHPDDIVPAANVAEAKFEEIQKQTRANVIDPQLLEQKARAFKARYVGHADDHFRAYLAACFTAYRAREDSYTAPYGTITQSSGFGKSRILQRLAESTAKGDLLVVDDTKFDVTVLYVCARNIKGSSGYPRATIALREWLFPETNCEETSIAEALLRAFTYAIEQPKAGMKWTVLFDNGINGKAFDGAVVESLKSVKLDMSIVEPEVKKQRMSANLSSESQANPDAKVPVLVVAIDEARALLEITNSTGINAFRLLRRALKRANDMKTVNDVNGIVFAVLADTYSRVHDFVPALLHDSSSRSGEGSTALFPPFILTETMDVMLYKDDRPTSMERVLDNDPERVWKALLSMGRPLWHSMDRGSTLAARQRSLNVFAAAKLLLGLEAKEAVSYNDTTLNGVSSLFCRVGLRPRASDPMAMRLVADFMSVLHYVTYKNDGHISSYSSDPVLTFGASRVWYQLDPPALESHILGQFQAMLVNGVVDTGNIGEIVARIFLLLAMDAATMGMSIIQDSAARQNFVFSGLFCKVPEFVRVLVSSQPEIRADMSTADLRTRDSYNEWLCTWDDWDIGFSHFVDLRGEPTE